MKIAKCLPAALALIALLPAAALAGTYVSFAGDFYFDYPEGWIQIDHRIVDAHLRANQAGATTMDYEAAFSPVESVPFFVGPYFILTVDTAHGPFSQAQIDSAVSDMGRKFGAEIRYFPVADFLADMKSNSPSYDAATRSISVIVDIVERAQVVKKNLLVQRFHERGVATFYFYAPDSLFSGSQAVFNQVLASFREGAEQALPKETLRVADIPAGGTSSASGGRKRPYLFWTTAAAIFIIAFAVMRRRRRAKG